MATSDYHFTTVWDVQSPRKEVIDLLQDAEGLPRWWPSVYLEVKTLAAGDANGIGKRVALYTKGWLPYTLRWNFTVTEVDSPRTFTLVADGDFIGTGVWTFEPQGENSVRVTYNWSVSANKPLLRRLSWLFKPIFSQNHHWAMARGEESLKLELARRAATTEAERAAVPPPPPATPNNPLKWLKFVLFGR